MHVSISYFLYVPLHKSISTPGALNNAQHSFNFGVLDSAQHDHERSSLYTQIQIWRV